MSENSGQKYDFIDRLAKLNFTSYESRVLLTIIKWHLVYNNGGVIISLSRIARTSGLPVFSVCRGLKGLLRKGAVCKTQKNGLPFYSFHLANEPLAIKPDGLANQPEGGLAIQPIKLAIQPVVISTSKEININNRDKENQKTEKDWKDETDRRFRTFFDQYPGAWHKGIEKKAHGHFLNSSIEEQEEFLKALKHYKNSKAVKDKKILSPLNFLNSPKIIKQYVEENAPKRNPNDLTPEKLEEWRRRRDADPPKESLLAAFERETGGLAGKLANQKSVSKKERGKP